MSDDKKSLINLVPESIDNAAKNISDAPTKNIGKTLGDLWFLVFGGVSQRADLRRAKYSHALEQYKKELEKSLSDVPEEHRIEPSSQVVLSALDESKYCVEEEELRKLFVGLLTSATDSRKAAHPSFASIIRQMSREDALMLKLFTYSSVYPICDLHLQQPNGGYKVLAQNLFLASIYDLSEEQVCLSISSLVHLGLCEIPSGITTAAGNMYEFFKETNTYKKHAEQHPDAQITIDKKIVSLTPLGASFVSCCLS